MRKAAMAANGLIVEAQPVAVIQRMKPTVDKFLMLAFLLASTVASAHASNFGSFAYNESNGAWGKSYNYSSQGDADRRALAECAQRGSGCKIVQRFVDECAAYARSADGGSGWSTAWTKRAAENSAMRYCKQYGSGCVITASVCTLPLPGRSNPSQPSAPGETTYDQMKRECTNAGGGNLSGSACVRY